MLSRHHIRIKVLQNLYAFEQSNEKDLQLGVQRLKTSLDQTYQAYLLCFRLIVDFADALERYIEEQNAKFLNQNRIITSSKLLKLPIIQLLKDNTKISQVEKNIGLSNLIDYEIHRKLIMEFVKQDPFKNIEAKENISPKDEYDLLIYILRHVFLSDESIDSILEEKLISWELDKYMAESAFTRTLKRYVEKQVLKIEELSLDWASDLKFALSLFNNSIENDIKYRTIIKEKAQNWEVDRITVLDLLLIKMGLVEFTHFGEIPIKVTLNEYVDLSKEFSSPNSKVFVNGLLDSISKSLTQSGQIIKYGKGLL